jgi:hypothetical protein
MSSVTSTRKGKAGRPPVENKKKPVIALRGSEEWRDWVNALSDHMRLRPNDLVDHALVRLAAESGFQSPAPKR